MFKQRIVKRVVKLVRGFKKFRAKGSLKSRITKVSKKPFGSPLRRLDAQQAFDRGSASLQKRRKIIGSSIIGAGSIGGILGVRKLLKNRRGHNKTAKR